MIIQQDTPLWKRLALPVSLALVAIAAYAIWSHGPEDGPAANDTAASASAGGAQGNVPSPFGSMATHQAPAPDGKPATISQEDWDALKAATARLPQGAAEAQRIVSYLGYQHDFEFWQSTIDSRNVERRHQMARALLDQLPERVAKGEFTGPEGTLMGTVLLGDLIAEEAKREKAIEEWTQKLNTAAPQPSDEKLLSDRDRMTELMRRRAVAYLEWQAKAPSERKAGELDKAFDDAQRWFASGAP
ncbi:hypothetical protein [Aquabacterium sp.]|uniref:hypothetical protein n=1 Tax=Aquabacterium sp. TaxID=1872578 RepID=UPI0025C575C0|nr:hypothetical protein [Aquabacterium sp.]